MYINKKRNLYFKDIWNIWQNIWRYLVDIHVYIYAHAGVIFTYTYLDMCSFYLKGFMYLFYYSLCIRLCLCVGVVCVHTVLVEDGDGYQIPWICSCERLWPSHYGCRDQNSSLCGRSKTSNLAGKRSSSLALILNEDKQIEGLHSLLWASFYAMCVIFFNTSYILLISTGRK